MVILDEWVRGRVVVVGDAAHRLLPWSSHGAGMALASAEAMSKEFIAGGRLDDALERWEKRVRLAILRLQARGQMAAPKFIAKKRPVNAMRTLLMRALGEEAVGGWQVLGTKTELELDKLDGPKVVAHPGKGDVEVAKTEAKGHLGTRGRGDKALCS